MTTWRCIACQINSKSPQNDASKYSLTFQSVKEFAEHLRKSHVSIQNSQGSYVYTCCYGPTGVCCANEIDSNTADSMHSTASFMSQREYEQHLVSCHMRQPPVLESNNVTMSRRCSFLNSTSPQSGARWNIYNSVVNLPAVLNDPTYRQVDIFARTWGDQFERAEVLPSPRLPVITEKHFERYLTKLHATGSQTVSSTRTNGYLGPTGENVVLMAVRNSSLSRQFPSDHDKGDAVAEDLPSTHIHSLKSIPPMFFEPEFSLQNWRTFTQVIPLYPRHSTGAISVSFTKPLDVDSDDSRPGVDQHRKQARDFRAQHDRLTHYLDIVEVHLAEQVSKKSSIFFEAVCCHDVVREQLSTALDHIRLVREKLHQVDSSVTDVALRLHRVVRRRANYQCLLEKLKIIASLQTAQPTIQLLLRSNDFCAALDLVSSTQESLLQFSSDCSTTIADDNLTRSQPSSTSTARQITCLRHVHAQLAEISRFVRHMIEAEFEAALHQFLASRPTGNQYSGPDLIPCLLGLLHIKRYDFVSAFRAELLRQIKLLQTNRPDGNDSSEPSLSLKEQLRSMSNMAWIEMVAGKCSALRDLLSRGREAAEIFSTAIQRSIAVDGISSVPTVVSEPHFTATVSEQTARELTNQLFVAMQTACAAAQKHVTDIVSLRNRLTMTDGPSSTTSISASNESLSRLGHSSQPRISLPGTDSALDRLSSGEFIRLVSVLEKFQEFLLKLFEETRHSLAFTGVPSTSTTSSSKSSPETSPNPTMALARLLLSLTRNSIQRFHRERSAKLDMILNQERWQAAEVPNQVQDLVNGTFAGSHRSGSELGFDKHSPPRQSDGNSPDMANNEQHVQSADDVITPTLSLNGERYVVVGTVLLLLPMIVDYVQLASRLPCRPIALFDLVTRLADLLNSFNSRTCQLVLGAEARKAADLPTISARNLALASRSLQLIAHCVPLLREHFDRLIAWETANGPPVHPIYAGPKEKRQLDPLEHVENLFNEHIGQINDKLFNLLSNRIQDRLCVWQVRPPTPSSEIRAICRALTRMVEMTGDIMPTDMLTPIIFRAHMEFKTLLRHRLGELAVVADGGPMQSLVDLELTFYVNQLRSLTPSMAKFNDDFSDVWPTN